MSSSSAKDAAADQDQSMEEILQSIRKIIAEENDNADDGSGKEPGAAMNAGREERAEPTIISDVLELTDVVEETPPARSPSPAPVSVSPPVDILSNIDRTLNPGGGGERLLSEESAAAASSALRSISEYKGKAPPAYAATPSLPFRSGGTVEDLVIEALRPMLKEWLDNNLPVMVERIVEREIRKLTE